MAKESVMPKTPKDGVPIQPVDKPILCSPYEEPTEHWLYDRETGEASRNPGRRDASYWFKTQRTGSAQRILFAEEQRDDLPLVNALRDDVRRWRKSNYENATSVTKQLFAHWSRRDRPRRLFFCQREAVETIIYLREILASGKRPRAFASLRLSVDDYQLLCNGEKPSLHAGTGLNVYPSLVDIPNESASSPLTRYGCKMATGSGKTVVMAMLIAWAFCNRGRMSGDQRFPSAALVVCPNLTIRERLQVLRPEYGDNYYTSFDIVPSQLVPELRKGKVLIENWHSFAPESAHVEGGKSYVVVNKGDEDPAAFARRVLGDLYDRAPLMVLNDEAHHAYRPSAVAETSKLTASEKADREEATVWISGLDKINTACGVGFCIDLSATPFYLHGSGYVEGSPFPWLVSDFGLVDAIESGIVKIPRLPVSDTTGRPEPKYFSLWKHITEHLEKGQKLPGGKPKPGVVWEQAQDALVTLASQWKERYSYIDFASQEKDKTPPVLIIVCDNTDIAELFAKNISGEDTIDLVTDSVEGDDASRPSRRKKKAKTKTVYGRSKLFQEFSNQEGFRPTLRIDSKLLNEAESEDRKISRLDAAAALREIVATVGKPGQPGEQVRCVVSVQMLTEGWDANNVTQILGLRAFGSQLLCEQVVGRGLRRMDYTPDPVTGLLTEEYVDIYGVPFSVIPFKGRRKNKTTPEDRPKNHVRSLIERKAYEIRFPVVENYVFALHSNLIKAELDSIPTLLLEPSKTPTAVFVKPQIGFQQEGRTIGGRFEFDEQDRSAYYESTHLQTIKFEIARQILSVLTEGLGNGSPKLRWQSRHQLFPQVLKIVDGYVSQKVIWGGCNPSELGLETYIRRIVKRLVDAIELTSQKSEPKVMPVLNRYKPFGSTSAVNFKTTRRCYPTVRSHINMVAANEEVWDQELAFFLEQSSAVKFYANNDQLEFVIPSEHEGVINSYMPPFLVRLIDDSTLILETRVFESAQGEANRQAAQRWVSAVNNWGKLGGWSFLWNRDLSSLCEDLAGLTG
jgi:type III restriction enzyme